LSLGDNEADGITAANAESPLTTPTYDGSGQGVHPDVLHIPVGWNSKAYWMAFTPFPSGDNQYENPSILASADGQTWVVPDGLTNPIDPDPTPGFNADTDLILIGSTMWCIYRHHIDNDDVRIVARSSTDGVTWSDEVLLFTTDVYNDISPAVIWDGSQFVMFAVKDSQITNVVNTITKRTCATINGTWSAAIECDVHIIGHEVWHVNVILDGTRLWALLVTADNYLYLGYSDDDGLTWRTGTTEFIARRAGQWDASLYRSAFLRTAIGFDVWYSGISGSTYRIGFTQAELA
jgi:hypothetical protein